MTSDNLTWPMVVQHLRRHGIDLDALGIASPEGEADDGDVEHHRDDHDAPVVEHLEAPLGESATIKTDTDADSWLDSLA